jgi:triphosphoribosyl-dephospho-CoA synthase
MAAFGTTLHATFEPLAAALSRLPGSCLPRGRGWSAAAASILEASAAKPGNVHPTAEFPDLTHAELVAAGLAIAPAMNRAAEVPLGKTILAAVTAARSVTRSNANLGIVLAIAPLAAVPDPSAAPNGQPSTESPSAPAGLGQAAVAAVLAQLTPADAADVWQAIRLAQPGGMGRSGEHDLAGPPPADLLAAMRLAAPRDAIARLWTDGYASLYAGLVTDLLTALDRGLSLHDAIVDAFLGQLAREPDSLIARKHGLPVALEVSRHAASARAAPQTIPEFDRFLRSPQRLNPGATADVTAAALYILIRDGRLLSNPLTLWSSSPLGSPPPPNNREHRPLP